MRVGIGYDTHRLVVDRPLILGGIEIAHSKGLSGHSDADVLTHAIADALLGAAALGNIGVHFPDTDEKNRDLDSLVLLKKVVGLLHAKGFRIGNIDVTVIAEAPKLNPHIPKMIEKLAATLGVETGALSVKATTHEGIGSLGRGEGISAMAVALIQPTSSAGGTQA